MARVTGFRRKFNPNQPRDRMGRWSKAGASSGTVAKRKSGAASSAKVSKIVGNVPGPVEGKSSYYTDRKNDFTAQPERRKRAAVAARRVSAVPYVRVSPHSATAGLNVGTGLTRNTRIIAGGYVRVERTTTTNIEQNIQKALQNASPLAKIGLAKVMGKSVKLPKGASAKLGTSSTGLPSVTVRKGYSRISSSKSSRAIADFNEAMARRTRGKKAKGSRPQRRKKNPPGTS